MAFATSNISIPNMNTNKTQKPAHALPISSVFDITHNVSETRGPVSPGKHSSLVSPPIAHVHMAVTSMNTHLSPPPSTLSNYSGYTPSRNILLSPASMVLDSNADDSVSSVLPPLFVTESPSSPHQQVRELKNDIHACLDRVAESQHDALYRTQSEFIGSAPSMQFVGRGYNDMYRRNCPNYLKERRLEQLQYLQARGSYQKECQVVLEPERRNISGIGNTPLYPESTPPSPIHTTNYSRPVASGNVMNGRIRKATDRHSPVMSAGARSGSRSGVLRTSCLPSVPSAAASAAYAVAIAASAEPFPVAESLQIPTASPHSRRAITSGATRGVAGSGVFTLEGFGRESGRRGAIASREDKNFEFLADICPPISTLDNPQSAVLRTDWKGNPINLDNDPNLHLLHSQEIVLASTLRLDCATYLTSKRRLFLSRLDCLERGKIFRKTDAQTACHIDVNKASRLYTAYEGVGWLDESWVEHHRGKVDLSPVQKSN